MRLLLKYHHSPLLLTYGAILFMTRIRASERRVRKEAASQRDSQTLEANEMSGPSHTHKKRKRLAFIFILENYQDESDVSWDTCKLMGRCCVRAMCNLISPESAAITLNACYIIRERNVYMNTRM